MSASMLLWLSFGLPLAGAALSLAAPRAVRVIGPLIALLLLAVVLALCVAVAEGPLTLQSAGDPEFALRLHVDGLSAIMLLMTALVGLAVSVYAAAYLKPAQQRGFWPLWLLMLAALNALYAAANLLHLYLALEAAGILAAALVSLASGREALQAALRYLFASAAGSLTMLMGAALLFAAYGTLDLATLGTRIEAGTLTAGGVALMVAGLVMKSALFPLHFWLPPFHAAAPAPVSALHSALVVKAAVYVLLRMWSDVFGALDLADVVATLLGVLGALAIFWGAINALRAERLKLIVAYSTVAQLGYLFVAFPLLAAAGAMQVLPAVAFFALAHALAKSAMFLAAGNLHYVLGHDRITAMHGVSSHLPTPILVFALAGASIIGLPPSGGFAGKWLLLQAALATPETMPWVIVILLGSLLSAGYIFRVLYYAFATEHAVSVRVALPAAMRWPPVLLASGVLLLGLLAPWPLHVLDGGMP